MTPQQAIGQYTQEKVLAMQKSGGDSATTTALDFDKVDLLSGLDDDTKQKILSSLTMHHYNKGDIAFSKGSTGQSLFFVHEGTMDVVVGDGNADPTNPTSYVVDQIKAGSVFGEMALLLSMPRTATMCAATNVVAFELQRSDFELAASASAVLNERLQAVKEERFARFRKDLERAVLNPNNMDDKQRAYLLEVFKQIDEDNSGAIDKDELSTMLTRLAGRSFSEIQVIAMMRMLDKDRNGTIEAEEFLSGLPLLAKWLIISEDASTEIDLEQVELLKGIDEVTKFKILMALRKRQYYKDDIVFLKGSTGRSLYLIQQGSMNVLVGKSDAHPAKATSRVMDTIQEGSVFGEMALMLSMPRTATIVCASTSATIYELQRNDFEELASCSSILNERLQAIKEERFVRFRKDLAEMVLNPDNIEPTQRAYVLEVFKQIDEDASGSIDKDELGVLLTRLSGRFFSVEQVTAMMQMLDKDGNGSIEAEEFLAGLPLLAKWLAVTDGSTEEVDLEQVELLKGIDAVTKLKIIMSLRKRLFYKEDCVFLKGTSGRSLFLVQQGTMDVLVGEGQAFPGDSSSRVVDQIEAGSVFGEMALLLSMPRTATIVCKSRTAVVYELLREDFETAAACSSILNERLGAIKEERFLRFRKDLEQMVLDPDNIDPQQRAYLLEVFKQIDSDFSGAIDKNELGVMLTRLAGRFFSDEQVTSMMEMLDKDGNGTIEAEEFLAGLPLLAKWLIIADDSAAELDLEKVDLLKGVDALTKFKIVMALKKRQFHKGDIVFNKGSTGRSLFFLQQGAMDVIFGEGDADPACPELNCYCVAQIQPGSVFGEMALLLSVPRTATVCVATETAVAFELKRADFEAAATSSSILEKRLDAIKEERFTKFRHDLETAVLRPEQMDDKQRAYLLEVFRQIDTDGSGAIDEQELGVMLNRLAGRMFSDREVSAMMKTLDKDGNKTIQADEFLESLPLLAKWLVKHHGKAAPKPKWGIKKVFRRLSLAFTGGSH